MDTVLPAIALYATLYWVCHCTHRQLARRGQSLLYLPQFNLFNKVLGPPRTHGYYITMPELKRLRLIYGGILALIVLTAYQVQFLDAVFIAGVAMVILGIFLFNFRFDDAGRQLGTGGIACLVAVFAYVTALGAGFIPTALVTLCQALGLAWLHHWAINPSPVRSLPE